MILVTGGAGYLGSHFLYTYLKANPNAHIATIDNLSVGHKQALDFSDNIHFFQEDIGNKDSVKKLLTELDIKSVVHFAGSCYVAESHDNPQKYFRNNVANSISLFESMQECGIKNIVFSSSCAVYGNPHYVPLDEKHPLEPQSVYGLTKLMIERILASYASGLGWSYLALRYANAAGADPDGKIGESHDPEPHLIPNALLVALGEKSHIEILGDDYDTDDGTCVRDYIHVNDLARAHLTALDLVSANSMAEAINLGTTFGYSVWEVIATCQRVTGKSIATKVLPRRLGDPKVYVANSKKAESILSWKPEYNLEKTIATAWQWEQSRRY